MGFYRRFLTKDLIVSTPEDFIPTLLDADGLIMDEWSSKFIEEFENGLDKNSIIKKLDANKKS